jgi:uracil-DNA glycosylase
MLMIGEAWGADEDKMKMPLVGGSGKMHWGMLGEAFPDVYPDLHAKAQREISWDYGMLAWVRQRDEWMHAAGIGFTNVLNMRPPNNDLGAISGTKSEVGGANYPYPPINKGRYLRPEYLDQLERLGRDISVLKPNVCCLMGNTACWAMLGMTNITALRGTTTWSETYGVKCLPTFHPASLLYEGMWSRRPIIIADYIKAYRESEYPEIRRPSRQIIINPTLQEVEQWIRETLASPPASLTIDVETSGGMIDTCGFARSSDDSLVIPFGPHRVKRGAGYVVIYPERNGKRVTSYWSVEEEVQVWRLVWEMLASPIPKSFQNGIYDIQYLMKILGIPNNMGDDTMLAWHSLYPELPKGLGFLGSILTNDVAWKRLRTAKSDTEKRDE